MAVAILVRNMRNPYILTNISINFPKELEDLKNKSSGTCMLRLKVYNLQSPPPIKLNIHGVTQILSTVALSTHNLQIFQTYIKVVTFTLVSFLPHPDDLTHDDVFTITSPILLRPWCTASICLCLCPFFPSCSSLVCLSLPSCFKLFFLRRKIIQLCYPFSVREPLCFLFWIDRQKKILKIYRIFNTGKSARQGNLTWGCRRFLCLALFASVWFYFSLLSVVVHCLTAMYF